MRKHKKWLILAGAAVLVVLAAAALSLGSKSRETAAMLENLAEVRRGSITDKVSGTGVVIANESYDITSLVSGAVLSAPFAKGDGVEQGDLLYEIDARALENQIKTARITLERTQEAYNQSLAAQRDLTTVSPHSGRVQKLYVSAGDFVTSGMKLADVTDNASLILKIPFNASDIGKIKTGDLAGVTLSTNASVMSGAVTRIYDAAESLGGYRMVHYVEITVTNPGAVGKGEKAFATVGGVACNSAGEFLNAVDKSIVAGGSGQVEVLNLREGETVSRGREVLRLKNDQVTGAARSGQIAVKEAANALDSLVSTLGDYKITAPAAGTVVAKNAKEGDNVMPAGLLMTVSDISSLYVDVEVDEIFIAKVGLGLRAAITAEALPGMEFTGEVVRINDVGVAKNGVTYYPVRVRIDHSQQMKVGMNLSVEILCQTRENTLLIPKAALENGSVLVYDGNKLVETAVETGIGDKDVTEVIKGLRAGDKIAADRR